MAETLHLGCGGDVGYLPHTAAMFASVVDKAGPLHVHVHYMHEPRLSRRDRQRFESFGRELGADVTLIEVEDERIAGLPPSGHLKRPMWYRCFLPELAPDVGKILYLDADTLALDSLEPLWAIDLGGNMIGAVSNVWEPWNVGYEKSLGLPKPYFNSGVMLMDLERMRQERATAAILDYAHAHLDRLPWGDQDPLNVALGGSRVELHPRWNCMNSVLYFDQAADLFGAEAVAEARANPGIRHFEGPSINKPWHYLCAWEGRDAYFRYRAQTPWPRVRRTGVTPMNVARRVKRSLRS
jgi:lipopolysaccharide biosynthesis glycosyltransferase